MEPRTQLIVADFIQQKRPSLEKVNEDLMLEPMTYEQRITLLEDILKAGIRYGIEKGIFLEEERLRKISLRKQMFMEKYVDELIFSLNYKMAAYRDLPKVKYSKRKYRLRKKHGGEQLKLKFAIC